MNRGLVHSMMFDLPVLSMRSTSLERVLLHRLGSQPTYLSGECSEDDGVSERLDLTQSYRSESQEVRVVAGMLSSTPLIIQF